LHIFSGCLDDLRQPENGKQRLVAKRVLNWVGWIAKMSASRRRSILNFRLPLFARLGSLKNNLFSKNHWVKR